MTNCGWQIDVHTLRKTFGLEAHIVNDFEAVALSLPSLTSADVVKVGDGDAARTCPLAVLGPGSGLGVACLIADRMTPIAVTSEGGHATLAGTSDREDAIIRRLREQFGHVSAERAISGPGLECIYQAVADLEGMATEPQSAAAITRKALSGECRNAVEALDTFCAFLGIFAGNVALTFAARGGVYIAGGIAPRIVDFLKESSFRNRFESKGRFRNYLKAVPTHVIVHPAATFIGLASLLEHKKGSAACREAVCE